jgi:hypothetical protein
VVHRCDAGTPGNALVAKLSHGVTSLSTVGEQTLEQRR